MAISRLAKPEGKETRKQFAATAVVVTVMVSKSKKTKNKNTKKQAVALEMNSSWRLTELVAILWVVAEGLKPNDTWVERKHLAVRLFWVSVVRKELILVSPP